MRPALVDTAISLPSDAIEARRTPWSEEAEISVLGAMLIDGDSVAVALEQIDDSAFHREGNRRIFRAMVRLYGRGDVIDAVTLADELQTAAELDAVGGMAYLAKLVDAVPTAANVGHHCRILRDKTVLRRLISSATEIIQDAYESGSGEVDETLDRADQRIFEISQA
ncbi:MAG: hypothetical protein F4Z33_01625 [Gemmatimonadales bacterium]|nr:hypothetical protein [Gemmatimonadales bacterium]